MKKWYLIYISIYLLTILDIAFTTTGLRLGAITEANPFLRGFMDTDPGLTSYCVLAYVGIALLYLYKASIRVRWISPVILGLAGIKTCILALHLGWVSVFFMG